MKNKKLQQLLVFLMLGVTIFGMYSASQRSVPGQIAYNDFWEMAQNGEIEQVILTTDENWQVRLKDGTTVLTPNPRLDESKAMLLSLGVPVKEGQAGIPPVLLFILGFVVVALLLRPRKTGAVGMAKYANVSADSSIPSVTFQDVAVHDEALNAMRDLVDFIKEPQKFAKYGARVPRGVMLYGPPGTGKTLLARALAGEAKAPFYAVSGADFVQVYVGVGASRIRELFKKARKAGAGVIFIDEIDAIGKKRDNGNDEREQTLNALLTEMSGFSGADGIVVLAATNRLDTLDEALLRAGRFDRQIEISLPDLAERLRILNVHANGKPLAPDVSLHTLAQNTVMFSGAQLESLLNEAAIRAARRQADAIEMEDINAAYRMVTVGDDRPGAQIAAEKRITAYHEAGHALATHLLNPDARVTRVSIIPSTRGAAGYMMSIPPERMLHKKSELIHLMTIALAGRAAEEIIFGRDEVTTGAANDVQKAREIAARMANEWRMGDEPDVDSAKRTLENNAYDQAKALLNQHSLRLHAIAAALMANETLDEQQFLKAVA